MKSFRKEIMKLSDTKTKDELKDAENQIESSMSPARKRAWELARQQGVKPIKSIKDLQGDFWPEDESVDEFLEWIHRIRRGELLQDTPE